MELLLVDGGGKGDKIFLMGSKCFVLYMQGFTIPYSSFWLYKNNLHISRITKFC